MAKIKLPFSIERPSEGTPATTAEDVDINAIEGIEATTVQGALEELKDKGGGSTDISLSIVDGLLCQTFVVEDEESSGSGSSGSGSAGGSSGSSEGSSGSSEGSSGSSEGSSGSSGSSSSTE